jgi:hypothetical protein
MRGVTGCALLPIEQALFDNNNDLEIESLARAKLHHRATVSVDNVAQGPNQ